MKTKLITLESASIDLYKFQWQGASPRDSFAIVGALHGDNFNALHICARLIEFLDRIENDESSEYKIQGKIQIFPTLNVPASQTGLHVWPADGLDSNLSFPGSRQGEPEEQMARAVYEEIFDAHAGILINSGARHYEDTPHLQCYKAHSEERKMAFASGLPILREICPTPTHRAQLFSQWDDKQTPALIFSGGSLGSLSQNYCDLAFQGILNILLVLKILRQNKKFEANSELLFFTSNREVIIRNQNPGLFQPKTSVGKFLKQGEVIGIITDPLSGKILEEIIAPEKGTLVVLRHLPIIYQSETAAILLSDKKKSLWPF
ncbi:MAG: hypothetical protein COV66_06740 [Nitrospinae bacterium CG11_big_fil_rev_8_21_14_0_20_45_15]|nr:MAG: hypothetical protein COV66_06740 [Nitrospinae bacterium CG11_big_fil_rev_8_21_14_0_20_45_15]